MMAQWHQQMAHMASMAAAHAHAAQAQQAQQAAQARQAQQQTPSPATNPETASTAANGLRADSAPFTMTASATPDRGASYNGCDASREAGQPTTQERKALSIIDPKSG